MNLRAIALLLLTLPLIPAFNLAAQETRLLGVALPLTGPLAPFGADFARAVELAVEQMNVELAAARAPVRFATAAADTAGTPTGAADALQILARNTGAALIIGPLTTAEVLGAKSTADANDLVLIAPASAAPAAAIPADNIFRVMVPPDTLALRLHARIARSRGYENVAILHPADPEGDALALSFQRAFAAAGGARVARIAFTPALADLDIAVNRLAAELARLSAAGQTAVFCVCHPGDALPALRRAMLLPALRAVAWMGIEALAAPELLEDAGVALFLHNAGFTALAPCTAADTPLRRRFQADFTLRFHAPPGPLTSHAFDAANIAMLASLVAGPGADAAAIRAILPFISAHYIGAGPQGLLDENGDQAIACYNLFQVNAAATGFDLIATYDTATVDLVLNP